MLGHGTQRRRSRGVEEIGLKGPPLKVNERQPANTSTHRRGCIGPIIGIIAAGFGQAQADVIRMESFEMSSPSETYTDPMDPSTDHPLLNHPEGDHERRVKNHRVGMLGHAAGAINAPAASSPQH